MNSKLIKLATLGPEGTFSHQVSNKVIKYLSKHHNNTELIFKKTISKLFDTVNNGIDIAVVPLENSEAGSIGNTMDNLIKHSYQSSLKIIAEIDVTINHYLTGYGKMEDIEVLYAHPQSYAQCELFIEENLNSVEIINTSSNSISAQKIVQKNDKIYGAIVPKICTEIYKLPIIAPKIQNSNTNTTRFILISTKDHIKDIFKSRIKSKSTIILDPRDDRPGLLYDILQVFANRLVNLTKIESRPSKGKLGDYIFYLDVQADLSHPSYNDFLDELGHLVEVGNLGSYNRIN